MFLKSLVIFRLKPKKVVVPFFNFVIFLLSTFFVSRFSLGFELFRVDLEGVFFKEFFHFVHRLESVEVV